MNRAGAEKVREALKVILEQCRATNSCENCPCIPQHPTARCYTRGCCKICLIMPPDTISGGGLND